mgnify:FL=1
MTKKDGGVIENWTFNTLSYTKEEVKEKVDIDIKTDMALVLSGYIKEDPTRRFTIGHHFRSSLIIEVDDENGIVETANTIYRLYGGAGEGLPDLGDLILKVFY